MNRPEPKCPVCRVAMSAGFIVDQTHGGQVDSATWAEGVPEKSAWGGVKAKDKPRLGIVSFRCPQCGWLVNFALESPKR